MSWAFISNNFFHNVERDSNAKTVTSPYFFVPDFRYNFRKTYWTDLQESSKVLILGPKMPHIPHFGHSKIFLQKRASSILCLLNPDFMQKQPPQVFCKKKVFWETSKFFIKLQIRNCKIYRKTPVPESLF